MKPRSALARVQQVGTLALAAVGLGWLWWQWPHSPVLAVTGLLLIWFGYAIFLAFEFLALRFAGHEPDVPTPSAHELARAWLLATWLNAVIFGWRQPFRWNTIPDHLPASASPSPGRARGVVLIHGFVCNRGFWTPWLKELRRRDIPFVAVNLEPGFASIDDFAAIIDDAVLRLTQATGMAPVLVCHSMGGLAARAWLRARAGEPRVHHVITIATPHRGTWFGRFSRAINARQMRFDSDWLRELATVPGDSGARFTCWYSNCDNLVFPVTTATLPAADNRLVPGAGHLELAHHPVVIAGSLEKITA
jgi:triacylglycerol lipase